jgi:hypothetical protein
VAGIRKPAKSKNTHVWFGFYENAFRLMRQLYATAVPLRPGSPFADISDAFRQQNYRNGN